MDRMTTSTVWIAPSRIDLRAETAQVSLFCFPYSGSSAAFYAAWALPIPVAICPIELPGHGRRMSERLHTRVEPLVRDIARGLAPYLDRPYAFFGHSTGAVVSFELARFLRREYGTSPIHLFVSGHGAPHLPHRDASVHALPDAEFIEKLREMNGTDPSVLANAELCQILLPILRADFAICETYQYTPGEPLDCPISVFSGLMDRYVTRSELEAWVYHTRARFRLGLYPGDHFFLNSNRAGLLEAIARDLYPSVHPSKAAG
jgi:medium-chain acyl-[acyl-carrier-protein] hydrolase